MSFVLQGTPTPHPIPPKTITFPSLLYFMVPGTNPRTVQILSMYFATKLYCIAKGFVRLVEL